MDKKTLLSFDKSAFFVVCVGLNLVFMVCVWGLIFDFAIFRAELQPRWRGFLPGFLSPYPLMTVSAFHKIVYVNVLSNEHVQIWVRVF